VPERPARVSGGKQKNSGGDAMTWIVATVLLLLWALGGVVYSAFKELYIFLNRMVSVAEKFYRLSQRY
jgi:beta-lactamase regulating signal transducer with metallopeptidase domain